MSIAGGRTRSRDQMNENRHGATARRKKISQPQFGAGETQILTSGVAFSVALRREKRGGQKFAPRPKRLYPYRKNPSVCHTVWGKSAILLGRNFLVETSELKLKHVSHL